MIEQQIASRALDDARADARQRDATARAELAETRRDAPQPAAAQLVGNEVVRFQAMREAYFALDKDATLDVAAQSGRIVFNRFVGLKEDAGKSAA